jgi:hypothetical protein
MLVIKIWLSYVCDACTTQGPIFSLFRIIPFPESAKNTNQPQTGMRAACISAKTIAYD